MPNLYKLLTKSVIRIIKLPTKCLIRIIKLLTNKIAN